VDKALVNSGGVIFVVRATGVLSSFSEEQVSEGFDLLFDADDEILVSREVMEWISEMETLRAGGLSANEIAETLKDSFPVSAAGVEHLLELRRDGLVIVAGKDR
jgi:hypothetical protein